MRFNRKRLLVVSAIIIISIAAIAVAPMFLVPDISSQIEIVLFKVDAIQVENELHLRANVKIINKSNYRITIKNVEIRYEEIVNEIIASAAYTLRENSASNLTVIFKASNKLLERTVNRLLKGEEIRVMLSGVVEGRASILGLSTKIERPFEREFIVSPDEVRLPYLKEIAGITVSRGDRLIAAAIIENPLDLSFNVTGGDFTAYAQNDPIAEGRVIPTRLRPRFDNRIVVNITKLFNPERVFDVESVHVKVYPIVVLGETKLTLQYETDVELDLEINISNLQGKVLELNKTREYEAVAKIELYGKIMSKMMNILRLPILNGSFKVYFNQSEIGQAILLNKTILNVFGGELEGIAYARIFSNQPIDTLIADIVGKYVLMGAYELEIEFTFLGEKVMESFPELYPLMAASVKWNFSSPSIVTPPISDPSQIPDWIKIVSRITVENKFHVSLTILRAIGRAYDSRKYILSVFENDIGKIIEGESTGTFTLEAYLNRTAVNYLKDNYQRGRVLEAMIYIDLTVHGKLSNLPFTITFSEIPLYIYVTLPYDP